MNPAIAAAVDVSAAFHSVSSLDYLPPAPLAKLQSQRLRRAVAAAFEHAVLYRQRMQKSGLTPADIRSIADLSKLPFTTEADLREAVPDGLWAPPRSAVVRLYPPGGMADAPVLLPATTRDLEAAAALVARCLAAAGLGCGDIIHCAIGYDVMADGLTLCRAAESLGACVIPFFGGHAERQLAVMKDYGVSAVCCTPGHFLHLLEWAEQRGVNLRDLPVRAGVFFGEHWSDDVRRRVEDAAGTKAYGAYSLPEIMGLGAAAECGCQDGLHVFEDAFFPEIVDPATGARRPDGQEGELVLTALCRQAMPLLRYRTRDITAVIPEPCACGRTLRRIRGIARRRDDMFVVRGVNVFPAQIEAALRARGGPLPHFQIVVTEEGGRDHVEVQVEVTPQSFSDRISVMEGLQAEWAHEIAHVTGVHVAVRLVEPRPAGAEPTEPRVLDKRTPGTLR